MSALFDIPPDAVRVWRGYRAPALPQADFFTKLGTVFVPATVKMQIAIGLDGYLPSVPAGLEGKPDTVPDETAILFWDSQGTYTAGFDTLAVRTYTLTHGAVYRPPSGANTTSSRCHTGRCRGWCERRTKSGRTAGGANPRPACCAAWAPARSLRPER